MCMKYININTACYESLSTIDERIISFNAPLNSVGTKYENDMLITDGFIIVTQIGFLGTNNKEHVAENVLLSRDKVDIIIRLTKRSPDVERRVGLDIDTFTIDLREAEAEQQINEACFEYYNYTRITNIKKIELPVGPGTYILKVLLKRPSDSAFTIQSMNTLTISAPKD